MKGEKLFLALGDVSDKFIEESADACFAQAKKRYPLLAASSCAAALLVFAIAYPRLRAFFSNAPVAETPGLASSDQPSPDNGIPKLAIIEASSVTAASMHLPEDHFDLELTEEQLKSAFPGLWFPVGARAYYTGDGTLKFVAGTETAKPGRIDLPEMFDGGYMKTAITIGQGSIMQDCAVIYEDEPKTAVIDGVEVSALRFDGRKNNGVAFFQADFTKDGLAYRVELHDSDTGEEGALRLERIVYALITGPTPDLAALGNPEIPELRFDSLTLAQAHEDPDFGLFIPQSVPSSFSFEASYRVVRPGTNSLSAMWGKEDAYIEVAASLLLERDYERLVHPGERSEPEGNVETNPAFLREELTLDVVKAQANESERIEFSVFYEGVMVSLASKGITPEEAWSVIESLGT
jgi:hypothetical protein